MFVLSVYESEEDHKKFLIFCDLYINVFCQMALKPCVQPANVMRKGNTTGHNGDIHYTVFKLDSFVIYWPLVRFSLYQNIPGIF